MSDCDPTDCSTPALLVPHCLLKFAQVHVHCIGDAIQLSHPQTPSSSTHNISQHRGLFQWVGCLHQSPKYQSFSVSLPMTIQGWLPLRLTGLISLLSKDSQEPSLTPQFEDICSLAFCLFYGPALTTVHDHWEGHHLDFTDLCWQSDISPFQHTV